MTNRNIRAVRHTTKEQQVKVMTKLAIFDTAVEGYKDLLGALEPQVHGHVIKPGHNGIDSISDALQRFSGVQELLIIAHGKAGSLVLGDSSLSLDSLPTYAAQIASWKDHLDNDAAIRIYGCELAGCHEGLLLADSLAELTGAEISMARGKLGFIEGEPRWELDYHTGAAPGSLPIADFALEAFRGHLAAGDQTRSAGETTAITFGAASFVAAFDQAGFGNSLTKLKVLALPEGGTLSLSGQEVAAGDEISIADLNDLTFEALDGYDGTTSFDWVGHDGSDYAPASVSTSVSGFGSDNGPVTVSVEALDVSGTLGNQVWGGIKVSGKSLDGEAKLVNLSGGGLGISGGKADGAIDSEVQAGNGGGGNGAPPVTNADIQGVWALSWQALDGSINDNVFQLATDPLVEGVVVQIPWYTIEVAEGVYDFSVIDAAIAQAEAVGTNIALMINSQTWGNGANENPYTVGPPKYIIDDHQTYGGSPGEGGIWPSKDHPGQYRTLRWQDNVAEKAQDMMVAVIEKYDQNETVQWMISGETATNVRVTELPDYDPDAIVANIIDNLEAMAGAADRLAITQLMNYVAGGTPSLYKIYDAALANGVAVGSPDLFGGSKEFNYYDVLDQGRAPVDMSAQWDSLKHIKNGVFSAEQMMDTGIDRLDMRAMFMVQNQTNSVEKFTEVLDVIRKDPKFLAWANGGDDTPVGTTNPDSVGGGDTVVSEELSLEFPDAVSQVTLRLQDLDPSESGTWQALDSDGNVVASGSLVTALGSMVSEGVFDFSINVGSPFSELVIAGSDDGEADFSIGAVTYQTDGEGGPVVESQVHKLSWNGTGLSGSIGEQAWGDVIVTATDLSGEPARVTALQTGLGVEGGREDSWIDYQVETGPDGTTGKSEEISFEFPDNVESAMIRLAGMVAAEPDFPDMAEVGYWVAYDSNGAEVGRGAFVPGEGNEINSRIHEFEIEPGADFKSLVIGASPYNGDPDDSTVADNSDFSIQELSYVVSPGGGTANQAPVVSDVEVTGSEDQSIAFAPEDFTGAFLDGDSGDVLARIRIETLPAQGQLLLGGEVVQAGAQIDAAALGQLTFVPDPDWHGETSFEWSGHDGTVFSKETASVKLTVEDGNQAPVASNDSGFTADGVTPVIIDSAELTKNDSDPDGDVLVVVSVGNATNGTVLLDTETASGAQLQAFSTESGSLGGLTPLSNGAITFVPDAGFSGTAQFDYTVSDGAGGTSSATVFVDVAESSGTSKLVLKGAEDNVVRFTASDFEAALPSAEMANSLAKIKVSSLPENGALLLNGATVLAGNEIAISDLSGLSFKPDADWHGETQFGWIGYGEDDAWMQASEASVVIESINDWPVAGNDSGFTTFEDVPLTIDLVEILANDTDGDLDLLSVQSVGDAQNGLVSLEDGSIIFTPNDGYTGAASFEYAVSDGMGGFATATVSLNVEEGPTDPIELVAEQGAVTTRDGETYWGDVKVSAEKWDGTEGEVFVSGNGGMGVADGRFNAQIDFTIEDRDGDGVGGDSERLIFDYAQDVTDVVLRLGRMLNGEWQGNVEVGMWEAFDNDGRLVGSGILDPREGTQLDTNAYEFEIDVEGSFSRLELSARPYNNVLEGDFVQDSSDYKVLEMSYKPAVGSTPVAAVETPDDDFGATLAATETGLNEDLFGQSGVDDVTQVM